MDKTIVILIIILLFILGIFVISQLGGGENIGNVVGGNSYPTQYSGGGCGR